MKQKLLKFSMTRSLLGLMLLVLGLALPGNAVAGWTSVTSITSGSSYYLSDGTNYVTLSGTTLSTTTTVSDATQFTFTTNGSSGYYIKSGDYYLRLTGMGSTQSLAVGTSTNKATWTFSNGVLSQKQSRTTYYITISSSSVSVGTSSGTSNVVGTYVGSVSCTATNGTLTANKTTAAVGETVTLTVNPNTNYGLTEFAVINTTPDPQEYVETTKVNDNTYTFTMPAGDVNANAVFLEWTTTGSNAFHQNTWSVEGDNDGTGMTTPFIESWVGANNTLPNQTITYVKNSGYAAGTYQVSILARMYNEGNTTDDLSGTATFNVNGTSVDMLSTGTKFTYNSASNGVYGTYTATVEVGEDGILNISFNLSGVNFDWIAFKNLTVTRLENGYSVKLTQPETGGTISATSSTGSLTGLSGGEIITLDNTPSTGYEFVSYTVKDASNNDVTVTDGKFTMPESDVTVSGTFNPIEYNVTSNLTYMSAASSNPTTVKSTDDALTLSYTANEDYMLPSSVEVKMGGTTLTSNYTWESGTLTINPSGLFTGDITVTASAVAIVTYNVTSKLTNMTGAEGNVTSVTNADAGITLNYTANTGYYLPSTIDVTMGGTALSTDDYSWENGELMIVPASGFSGNIIVKASGIAKTTPTFTIADITVTNGDDITPVITTGNTDSHTVTYTSSNSSVVSVSSDGKTLTTAGAGEATITATMAETANFKAVTTTFKVTVKATTLQTLFETTSCGNPPYYRIPAIVKANNGTLIALADSRPNAGDLGYTDASISIVYKTSINNGQTWSAQSTAAQANSSSSGFDYCFSDPAAVADRESNNILLISGAGKVKYNASSSSNFIKSAITRGTVNSDGTVTWGTPSEFTSTMKAINSSLTQAFVASGKICQSKIYKKNNYYRIYAAMITNLGGLAIYSDDFGATWSQLGSAAGLPTATASGVDEPKCEELPDGRVLISARVGGGRWFNIYTFTELSSGTGSWSTPVKSSTVTGGISALGTSKGTNGDVLIVPVKKSDNSECYLALAGLPAGSGDSGIEQQRCNLKIYYKELSGADLSDLYSVTAFASNWDGSYQVSTTTSAYSSMNLDANGDVAFLYEENLLKNDGTVTTTSYEEVGYDIKFHSLSIADITNNAYTYNSSVNTQEYLQTYFTAVKDAQTTWTDANKAVFTKLVNNITTPPTAAEMDAIYSFIANPYESAMDTYTIYYVDASNPTTILATETKSVAEGDAAPTADTKSWYGWTQGEQTVSDMVITVPMTNLLENRTYRVYTLASDGTKCYLHLTDGDSTTSPQKTKLQLSDYDNASTFTFTQQGIGTYGALWAMFDGTYYLGGERWNSTQSETAFAWTVLGTVDDGGYYYQATVSGKEGFIGLEKTTDAATTSYTRVMTNKTYDGAELTCDPTAELTAFKLYLEAADYEVVDGVNVKVLFSGTDNIIKGALDYLDKNGTKTDNSLVYVVNDANYKNSNEITNVVVGGEGNYTCASLVLTDAVSFQASYAFTAMSASYERAASALASDGKSYYSTIILPFAVQCTDNVHYYLLSHCNESGSVLTVDDCEGVDDCIYPILPANTPAIFKKYDTKKLVVDPYYIDNDETKGIEVPKTPRGGSDPEYVIEKAQVGSTVNSNFTMVGVLQNTVVHNDDYTSGTAVTNYPYVEKSDPYSFYISGDKFYKINKYFKMRSFRAYISDPEKTHPSWKSSGVKTDYMSIGWGDYDDTDKVQIIEDEAGNPVKMVFDLNGRRLSTPQRGVNIINGKKVMMK